MEALRAQATKTIVVKPHRNTKDLKSPASTGGVRARGRPSAP